MRRVALKQPIDVPTQATASFIASWVPSGAAVLEVGCGEGHLARELLRRGYRVIGVDTDQALVARAQERGVTALQASWPEFECEPVDAVVFTRSLHHINPLRKAVGRAREVLRPTGMILIEDFAFDEADTPTINWFLKVIGSRTSRALMASVPGEFVTELLASEDRISAWRQSHDHELHTTAAMTQAIAEYFVVANTQAVPYLYRYLVPVLSETAEAAIYGEEVYREEARLGDNGELILIGRRVVGSAKEAVTR